jgi:Mn2+/Fe2+ NRAMP family transporter
VNDQRPGGNPEDPRHDPHDPQGQPQWGQQQQWGQQPQGNWHPEGLPPSAMQPMRSPENSEAPVDIETARHLWFGVIGIGLLSMLIGLYSLFTDRDAFLDAFLTDLEAQDPSLALPPETADTVLVVAMVLSLIVGVLIAGLVLLVVRKMRAGKLWARAVLTAIGVVIVVTTIPTLFGLGSGGAIALVTAVLGILQAVAAAGAVYLMHRRESSEYFLSRRSPR